MHQLLSVQQPLSGHQKVMIQLSMTKASLEECQDYSPARIAQVASVLKSKRSLSQHKRNLMAKTLLRVQESICRDFGKVGEGIANVIKAVQDGLFPVTKGYKGLQENFDDLVQGSLNS